MNLGRASGGPFYFSRSGRVKYQFWAKKWLPKINLGRASGGPFYFSRSGRVQYQFLGQERTTQNKFGQSLRRDLQLFSFGPEGSGPEGSQCEESGPEGSQSLRTLSLFMFRTWRVRTWRVPKSLRTRRVESPFLSLHPKGICPATSVSAHRYWPTPEGDDPINMIGSIYQMKGLTLNTK